jgi:Peptide N-acetyl-beta-D-glucosaminyl asparaginase amidase A
VISIFPEDVMPSSSPDPTQLSLSNQKVSNNVRNAFVVFTMLVFASIAVAQTIGSANTATADPPVRHPETTPCTVQLFSNFVFADFNAKTFQYMPTCAGPWAKVILIATFSVDAGRQFDRTANMWLGNTNIYFGTTAEPSHNVSRIWTIQRDITDYSALLTTAQTGTVHLDNLVNSTYTSSLHGDALLQFYPPGDDDRVRVTADQVLPLNSSPNTATLNTTTDQLAGTFTLPTNIERAYLDVFSQSQSNDEFWYTCVPNDVATELQSCGNTGFRESEITIDGNPAGIAPVYPWIYTGGIDPYLWRPIPDVQTLNFVPYRVDLTPFAAALNDGNPHTVAVNVFNANSHFAVSAALLLYQDHGSTHVTGGLLNNTLTAGPSPTVTENLVMVNGLPQGYVTVTSSRHSIVKGYVNTSHGKVVTGVEQNVNFTNRQHFVLTSTLYEQDITQSTDITATASTVDSTGVHKSSVVQHWPLTVGYSQPTNPDGSFSATTTINQSYQNALTRRDNGETSFWSVVSNTVSPSDTLEFNSSGSVTGNTGQANTQTYKTKDSTGYCYSRTLTAAGGVLTGVVKGQGCDQ